MRTALITNPQEIRDLRPAWRCTDALGTASIFTSPEWCQTAWRCLPELGLPRLLIAQDRHEHVQAILPLSARSGALVCAGSPLGDEHDLRVHSDAASTPIGRGILAALESYARTEGRVQLRDLRDGGVLARAANTTPGCPAPLFRLNPSTMGTDAPPWLLGGSPRRRRTLTRHRRALDRLGAVTVDRVADPQQLHDAVARFVPDRLRAWRQRGRLHQLPDGDRHPQFAEFLATAAAALAHRGHCFLNRLLLDGRALAQALYFRVGCADLLYMATYEPDFSRYSPSHLLLTESTATAAREGITMIELGRGDEQYKFDLGAEPRYLRDIIL